MSTVSPTPENKGLEGRTIKDFADEQGKAPADDVLDLRLGRRLQDRLPLAHRKPRMAPMRWARRSTTPV